MKRSVFDTSIDPDRLDIEQVTNVEMIKYWNKQIAILTKNRDQAKNELKLYESKQRIAIEKDPEEFELDRYTDKLAEASFIVKRDYQTIQEKLVEADFQLRKAYGYKEAFVSRGSVLDNLQKLYLSNYYAEYHKRNKTDQDHQKSASDMLDGALKKRKKKKVKEDE